MLIGLPTDHELLDNEDIIIDMNKIDLGIDNKLSKFIYIRNCGIKNKLYFGNCSYKDKEDYILTYMENDIDIKSIELTSTWASILSNDVNEFSILNENEIKIFNINNKEYINMIKIFISSILFFKADRMNKDKFKLDIEDKIEETEFDKISLYAIHKLFNNNFNQILPLVLNKNLLYFKNIFNKRNSYYLINIINSFTPFNELLILIYDSIKGVKMLNGINN